MVDDSKKPKQKPEAGSQRQEEERENREEGKDFSRKAEAKPGVKEEKKLPSFRVGDTVKVYWRIREEGKERVQPFEGVVIAIKGSGVSRTFTVRKLASQSIGVERIFPLHSPNIQKMMVVKEGKVRRAKLYYLRRKVGKKATRIRKRTAGAKATVKADTKKRGT